MHKWIAQHSRFLRRCKSWRALLPPILIQRLCLWPNATSLNLRCECASLPAFKHDTKHDLSLPLCVYVYVLCAGFPAPSREKGVVEIFVGVGLGRRKAALFLFLVDWGLLHAADTKKKTKKKQSECTFCPQPEHRAGTHTRTAHSLSTARVHFRPQPEHREDVYTRTTHSLSTKMGPCTHCIS